MKEFVVTAVILTPGACVREGLGRTSIRRSAGSGGVSHTSVSSTRIAIFASGKSLGEFFGGRQKPAGMGARTPWVFHSKTPFFSYVKILGRVFVERRGIESAAGSWRPQFPGFK